MFEHIAAVVDGLEWTDFFILFIAALCALVILILVGASMLVGDDEKEMK